MAGPNIKDLIAHAETAARSGDTGRAAAIYREILTRMPKHSRAKKALARLERQGGGTRRKMTQADANQLLGVLNTGNFPAVEAAAQSMIATFGDEPFLYNILGYAQGRLGKEAEAARAYRWAIKLNPNFVEAMSNLGSLLVQIGKPREAVEVLTKAIAKKPDYAEAHHNIGVAYASLEDQDKARGHYDTAIRLRPDYANAYNSRGSLSHNQGNTAAAIADFRKASEINPADAGIFSNLAGSEADAGHVEAAVSAIERALRLEPDNVDYLLLSSLVLTEAGRKDAAADAFRELLKRDPDHAEALRLSVDLFEGDERDARLDHMAVLLDRGGLDPMAETHLCFGLGQHYDSIRDPQRAAPYLARANAAYRGILPPEKETDAERFIRIRAGCENGDFDHLKQHGSQDERPVFVVGQMRSGTTLVEQIIASHSKAYGAGELMAATTLSQSLYRAGPKATPAQLAEFQAGYLDHLSADAGQATRIVDKMPGNFFHVGLIRAAFPKARIINTVRDPRDTCFSIWKNFFDTYAHQYAYDQAELARFANDYKRLMDFWDSQFPGEVYHIRYEDLVADQEGESRRLLEHLGLDWEDGVLEFHKTERAVHTASVNQVRRKIYKTSLRSWEPYQEHFRTFLDGLDRDLWKDALVE